MIFAGDAAVWFFFKSAFLLTFSIWHGGYKRLPEPWLGRAVGSSRTTAPHGSAALVVA